MNFFYGNLHITGDFKVNGILRFRDDLIQESMLDYHVQGDLVINGDVTITGNVEVGGTITTAHLDCLDQNDDDESS